MLAGLLEAAARNRRRQRALRAAAGELAARHEGVGTGWDAGAPPPPRGAACPLPTSTAGPAQHGYSAAAAARVVRLVGGSVGRPPAGEGA